MRVLAVATVTLVLLAGASARADDPTAPGYRRLEFAAPKPGTYELASLGAAADGSLLDDRGQPVRLHALFGDRIAILSFVYTTCHDTNGCPLASFVLSGVQTRLLGAPEVRDRVRIVTVSFDPEHDHPEVMRAYGERLRKPGVDWRFLTAASERELAPTLAAYGQTVRKDYDANGNYLGTMSHVLRVYLIDSHERIRNVYSTSFLHPDVLLADIETLLLEDGASTTAAHAAPTAVGIDGAGASPLGLPPVPAASGGADAIALGRKLFFDRRLSANGTLSCAMCHIPEQAFTNNEITTAVGIEGRTVRRNAPTLYNVAYAPALFHDGRAKTLEEQAWGPLLAHDEMGNASPDEVVARIRGLADYARLFERAFAGEGPSHDRIGAALAGYERTLLVAGSAFDRWYFGHEDGAVSDGAKAGFALFTGKAGCSACHALGAGDALFTDYGFHDTGIAARSGRVALERAREQVAFAPGVALDADVVAAASGPLAPDEGRYEATHDRADLRKYKTPSLRNVALTSPYMHDGSLPTLRAVVDYYAGGGEPDDLLDARIHPLDLDEDERTSLVAFLESLSGDTRRVVADALQAPVGNPN